MKKLILTLLFPMTIIASPIGFNQAPIPGLVGWWTFNEGSGTNAQDYSGKGNTGWMTNYNSTYGSNAWTTGVVQSALNFSNTTPFSSVVIPGSSLSGSPLSLSNLTICAWINYRSWGGGGREKIVDKSGNAASGYSFYIGLSRNALAYAVGGTAWETAPPTLLSNTWIYASLCVTNTTITFYTNGVLYYSLSGINPTTLNTFPVVIGGRQDGARSFDGLIDDVRIYNRALTPYEVQELYNGGYGRQLP
jgi:hypothetical protein